MFLLVLRNASVLCWKCCARVVARSHVVAYAARSERRKFAFPAPMEQIRAFVQFRDKNLDHQLFGALENHRDLIVVS